MSPSGRRHSLCSEQLLFFKRSICHMCFFTQWKRRRPSLRNCSKKTSVCKFKKNMGLAQEESSPKSKITLKPLGIRQMCAALKPDIREAPVTGGGAGLTWNLFGVSGLSNMVTRAICFPIHHSDLSILKSSALPEQGKKANSVSRLTIWF